VKYTLELPDGVSPELLIEEAEKILRRRARSRARRIAIHRVLKSHVEEYDTYLREEIKKCI